MAINKIYAETQELNRDRALADITAPSTAPTAIQSGVPVVLGSRPAVSLTASGGSTKTETNLGAGVTSITFTNGGVGNEDGHATFAFDGTFEFAVTGATATTKDDVKVYITSGGELTLTASTNTHYGYTDYPQGYQKVAGRAPVKIGA